MKNNDPIFWPGEQVDLSLRQKMDRNYNDCINILQTQWYQGDLDQRFAMGDQDIWGLIFPGVATYRRKIFNFNMINSTIQMVTGYQRRNRKTTVVIPVMPEMQKTADQMTKCLFHVHNQSGAYQVYSDAFEQGSLIQGLGFVSVYKDTTNDPVSGDIKLRYIDMKSCLFDPYFRKHDGSDMRFFRTRQFFDIDEAANLYPQFRDEILALPRGSYRDDKFYYMPEVYQIQFPNLVALDEYWYLTSRECTYLVDKETGETQEAPADEEDLRIILSQFKDRLKIIKQPKPTYRRTIILNDRVLIDEPNPYKIDRLPYVPFLGYFSADTPYYAYKFRGIVRDLRDTQYLFNRLKVADLDILESQQQGLKIKKGALVTPEDGLNQGHGRMLVIDDKYQMSDVEAMPIIPPAPAMLQMEEMLKQTMREISNVNETLLGTDTTDQSAIQTMIRNSAGITTLTRLFDQFDESQRLCGDIIIEMIQKNWTYGKVRQVIGEEPSSEFDDKAFFKYGCKVVQGILTESQQQMELQQLLYLRETTGINIPSETILKAATLQNKDDLIKAVVEREQAEQEQAQQMQQLQMQQLQVDTETKLAYARSQDGLAKERVAKIQTDKAVAVDKLRRAHQEDTHSALNVIKALKELQSMDLDNMVRELELINGITQATQASTPTEQAGSMPTEQPQMEQQGRLQSAMGM